MQGPSVIGAALALRDVCGEEPYKIVIYGAPAEETIGGKIIMKEKGCFQDIDIALMMHAAPNTCVDILERPELLSETKRNFGNGSRRKRTYPFKNKWKKIAEAPLARPLFFVKTVSADNLIRGIIFR